MNTYESAYFAGGCFWCITPTFKETPGVLEVVSGYCGGSEVDPSYEDVKYQRTGHRETIAIRFSPALVSFDELLEIFLRSVDPFDAGGQYIDRGHSYTLAVYHTSQSQREAAGRQIRELEEISGRKVFIALEPFLGFYPAEEEHQDYYLKHPREFEEELIASGRKKTE